MALETIDETSFPILRGRCKVDEEGFHIENNFQMTNGKLIYRMVLSLIMIVFFSYREANYWQHHPFFISILNYLVIVLNILRIAFLFRASFVKEIPWTNIKKISYKKGIILSYYPVILIHLNNNKKRAIVLPSMFRDGNSLINEAKRIISYYQN